MASAPHRSTRLASLIFAIALSPGCSADGGFPTLRDGGADARRDATTDATLATDGGRCEPGTRSCTSGMEIVCGPDGRPQSPTPCPSERPMCAAGAGCVVCIPNQRRCSPSTPNVPQRCGDNGAAWVDQAACDSALGQTCNEGVCTDPCSEAARARSYIGCDYYPVTTINNLLVAGFAFAVAIANPGDAPVTARVEGGALTAPIERTIAPGAVETIELPWVPALSRQGMGNGSALARGGAYHLRTTRPVTVYQFNPLTYQSGSTFSHTNDASLLLPSTVAGTRYLALTFGAPVVGAQTSTFVAIVGLRDTPTRVTVRPTVATLAGTGVTAGAAGTPQMHELGRGDVLQLVGNDPAADLTGTEIESSSEVAVFVGHGCTNVPGDRVACDHTEEQLFPLDTWGRRYAVSRFTDRPGTPSLVRILAQRDNTHLTFDPPSAAPAGSTLSAREVLSVTANDSFVVSADQPILVAQFMYGRGTESDGDPSMVFEVPVEQYRPDFSFLTPATYTRSFVNIVGPTASPPTLDGAAFPGAPSRIGGSELSLWSTMLMPGEHRVAGSATYGIKVYGTAFATSYAYPGGLDLRVINPPE